MTLPEFTTPEDLARHMGISQRRVRSLARQLGACRIFGNAMRLTKADVDAILKAVKPCPSRSIDVREAMSGTIEGRLPDIDSAALLAHLTKKTPKELRPRSRTPSGNVVTLKNRKG